MLVLIALWRAIDAAVPGNIYVHCMCPHIQKVKRVYDVCQYIFSGEGEYVLGMHYIFSQHSPSF